MQQHLLYSYSMDSITSVPACPNMKMPHVLLLAVTLVVLAFNMKAPGCKKGKGYLVEKCSFIELCKY